MPHPEIEQLEPQIEKLSLKWLTTNFWIDPAVECLALLGIITYLQYTVTYVQYIFKTFLMCGLDDMTRK